MSGSEQSASFFPELLREKQAVVVSLDRAVTLAGSFPQTLDVEKANVAARVFDQARLLQRVGDDRNARAAHAEHLREELLRQHQIVAIGKIAHAQEPAAHARFDRVAGVAG